MVAPVWPASLPQTPLLRGFDWEPQSNEEVFQPSIGPPIIGPAMADAGDVFNVTFMLTPAQLEIWRDFWKTDVSAGAIAWTMPDWIGPATTCLVTKVSGTKPKIIPIGSGYLTEGMGGTLVGLKWELSLSIYRRPYI